MIVTVQRLVENTVSTIGQISVGDIMGSTLELPFGAVKVPGKTRIPAGQYVLLLNTAGGMNAIYKQKFGDWHKGMLWLQDVPQFEDVYLHIGNYPKDTLGCILVGSSAGNDVINSSTAFYQQIYPIIADAILAGQEVLCDVLDPSS